MGKFFGIVIIFTTYFSSKTAGNLLSAKKFKFFLPYLNRSKITTVQRFHGWMQAVKTYAWAALILPLFALPICFLLLGKTGREEEFHQNQGSLRYVYIILWATHKFWKRTVFGQLGVTDTFSLSKNRLWITPYIVYSFYESHWVDLAETKFEISGTFESPVDERSRKTRSTLWTRMTNSLVLMHTVYWIVASVVLVTWIWTNATKSFIPSPHTGITVRFLEIVMAASVPVMYMAFPPSAVNRRERLARDETGTFRVLTKTWSGRGDQALYIQDLVELLIIVMFDWLR